MKQRRVQFFLLAALAYIGLRLAGFLPSSAQTYPDTGTYLHTADESLFSREFWSGWRPWTVPLFYKLLPDSDTARAAGQLVVSISCWLALAAAVAWNVRRPGMRPVAFAVVLTFSLSVWITQWDTLLLSESLSVSLAAATLAAWLALARAPGPWTVAAVLFTTVLWAFTRDTLGLLPLLAVPLVVIWAAVSDRRREPVALAIGLLAIGGAAWLTGSSETAVARERLPLLNVIGARVLTDPDELRFFRDHGMPLPPAIEALAGEPLPPDGPLASDPRVADFLDWVREDGRETLIAYLVTHPYRALEPVIDDAEILLEPEPDPRPNNGTLSSLRAEGTDPLLPGPLAAAMYPPSAAAVLVWLALAAAIAAWLARAGLGRAVWFIPGAVVLLQFPHAAAVWHGDAWGVTRHALAVGVLTRLGLLVLTLFLIDAALEWRERQRRAARDSAIAGVSGATR